MALLLDQKRLQNASLLVLNKNKERGLSMIITKISRLGTYVKVNPHFATLIDFLEKQD